MGAFGRRDGGYRVPTTGAIGNARRRLGSEPVETIVRAVLTPVADDGMPGSWYKNLRLTAVDGTTFTVPDSEENDREFGRPGSGRGERKSAYPQIRAACLIEIGTHAVLDARLGEYAVAETTLAEEMFSALRPGMLMLADRRVYSFQRWIRAVETGAELLWRVTANLTLRPVEHLPDGSYIAEVIPPAKCGKQSFRLRVVEYRVTDDGDGPEDLYRLVTTLLDPTLAPAKELAVLYHERWEIEGFFKQIKSVQLNDAKIFRSKSPVGVHQEFWAHLAVHHATTRVMTDAARHANLDPDRISHKNTVRVIRSRIWIPDSSPPQQP